MRRVCTVHHIDAFSDIPNKGNPAGVVLDAEALDSDAMQAIAKAVGFNETAFLLPSTKANHRIRFFTPGHEMPLCGHATIATLFHLYADTGISRHLHIETSAGILPVSWDAHYKTVSMRQTAPKFQMFSGDRRALGRVLGVDPSRLAADLPIIYGSTGTWTLLVPMTDEGVLTDMVPENAAFPEVLQEMPRASIHPFAVAEKGKDYDFAARHFSSPHSGTKEDPVTGTASGVMGAYAMLYLHPDAPAGHFAVKQGASVGRDGTVLVDVVRSDDDMRVTIKGAAVRVGELSIAYPHEEGQA